MSTTPPPPGSDAAGDGDWRNNVTQSDRSKEVREIAEVLAGLEPGASSSSKLRLAMQFEDMYFKQGTSFDDYQKKMKKKLKKLQKTYVPPTAEQTGTATLKKSDSRQEQLLLELRHKYGESLRYISLNAPKAIEDVKSRQGQDKSHQLQQHTDSAITWATELGVVAKQPDGSYKAVPASSALPDIPESHLQKLQQHLEKRVENIRQYVVKHADPDLFLQETLQRKDQELPMKACQLLGVNLTKRVEQLQKQQQGSSSTTSASSPTSVKNSNDDNQNKSFQPREVLQEALEKAHSTTVPPPTRNNSNDIPAAMVHLDKMRAASTAILAYLALPDRHMTAPKNALSKAHAIALQGMDFIMNLALKKEKEQQSTGATEKSVDEKVQLQDAWVKVLELEDAAMTSSHGADPLALGNDIKRQKLHHVPPVTKSRVLLRPQRKIPPSLIYALKRKRAKLVRPESQGGRGAHLILDFGKAFTMTIFLSPLLVTFRAMDPEQQEQQGGDASSEKVKKTNNTPTFGRVSSSYWSPLYQGLAGRSDLQVWGTTGTYDQIGHVVEERLRDASTHATHILRKCFRNHVKDKTSDFDVEILEASALLEFLQLARTTYIPNWQDDENLT